MSAGAPYDAVTAVFGLPWRETNGAMDDVCRVCGSQGVATGCARCSATVTGGRPRVTHDSVAVSLAALEARFDGSTRGRRVIHADGTGMVDLRNPATAAVLGNPSAFLPAPQLVRAQEPALTLKPSGALPPRVRARSTSLRWWLAVSVAVALMAAVAMATWRAVRVSLRDTSPREAVTLAVVVPLRGAVATPATGASTETAPTATSRARHPGHPTGWVALQP